MAAVLDSSACGVAVVGYGNVCRDTGCSHVAKHVLSALVDRGETTVAEIARWPPVVVAVGWYARGVCLRERAYGGG